MRNIPLWWSITGAVIGVMGFAFNLITLSANHQWGLCRAWVADYGSRPLPLLVHSTAKCGVYFRIELHSLRNAFWWIAIRMDQASSPSCNFKLTHYRILVDRGEKKRMPRPCPRVLCGDRAGILTSMPDLSPSP